MTVRNYELIHDSTTKRAHLPSVVSAYLRACNLLTLSPVISAERRAGLQARIDQFQATTTPQQDQFT